MAAPMATPEFIDGGLKLLAAATIAARNEDARAIKHAPALAALFSVPDETIALLEAIIEGQALDEDEIAAGLAPLDSKDEAAPALARSLAEANVEALLGRTRKSIRGGALLPRVASGKVSLAPSVRRTAMYHANEAHRGGAREVVRLYKECATMNEHAEALLFAAGHEG